MSRYEEFWTRQGIDPDLYLPRAVADFYALEGLKADHNPWAGPMLADLEQMLAGQFSAYLDVTVGGELRHAKHHIYHGQLLTIPRHLRRYMHRLDDLWDYDNESIARMDAWKLWSAMRRREPEGTVIWFLEASSLFVADGWRKDSNGKYGTGGPGWATAARVEYDWLMGCLKPRTFVDRCFTLEHNFGCIFDKCWNPSRMREALELQASGDYDTMVRKYASQRVKRAHLYHRDLLTSAVGKRFMREQAEYNLETEMRRIR